MNKQTTSFISVVLISFSVIALAGNASAAAPDTCESPMGFGGPLSGNMPTNNMPMSGNGMPPGGPIRQQLRLIYSLDLSPGQQEKLGSILDENRPRVRDQIIALHQARHQLHAIAMSEMDEDRIGELADMQGKTIAKLIKLRGEINTQIRSILTEQQKASLLERFSNSHGHRQGCGPGRPNHMLPTL